MGWIQDKLAESKKKGTGIYSWGGAISSALGSTGGALGAAVGSAVPGIGTALGGAIGQGISGLFQGSKKKPKNQPGSFAEGLAIGYGKETQGYQVLYLNKNQ